jgi:hypothetical protein
MRDYDRMMSDYVRRGSVEVRELGGGVTEYVATPKLPGHLDLELCLALLDGTFRNAAPAPRPSAAS